MRHLRRLLLPVKVPSAYDLRAAAERHRQVVSRLMEALERLNTLVRQP